MIKCPVCGAELANETPFCPICGASLSPSMRPFIAGLIHLAVCALALYFIPQPYAYFVAVPFLLFSLMAFGAGGLGVYRTLVR
ncbi:MAG: zinc-ribbon domain-containing protein [Rhodomicrobium sp.]